MRTVGDIVRQYKKAIKEFPDYHGRIYVNIDDTGLGGGVTDRLREVKREDKLSRLYVVPINAAEKIETDTKAGKDAAEHYNNLTTHMSVSYTHLGDLETIIKTLDEVTQITNELKIWAEKNIR